MNKIKMRSDLIKKVYAGEKTATTRLGIKENINLGFCYFYDPEVPSQKSITYEIHKLELVAYCDLTDEIARLEGYGKVDELREALLSIYKHINDYDTMTVIYFDHIEKVA